MSLLGDPAPDFSDPLALLGACHQRMLGLCDLLERMPAWIEQNGIDDEVIAATQRVMRYFTTAAPLHHEDEEQDLFPLLPRDSALATLITELHQDHQRLEYLWQSLACRLEPIARAADVDPGLSDAITAFCEAYRSHIEREDGELLPRARTLLNPRQCTELGARMAARRGHDTG